MTIPEVSTALRQSLERHRFSLRPQPEGRPGEETVHVVLDHGEGMFHVGRVELYLGLWTAFAVVRGNGLFRSDEVGRHEPFEDAVLAVLMSFTHVE
ncbi:hypothetical protein [Streptomyces sp. IB2014 016-6]|uniref:hypothetical protein n=1 Tax=Streptomyces sp. IB2014 016-6 TaxID=2517818 RepID=UPI0011C7181B|nr:hypothetical protein [Streptomyces sp. IB2014 016-6]TXL86649.1 hypothetical protein EW053_26010 [Streptomyces sp. IB2014 016-6]